LDSDKNCTELNFKTIKNLIVKESYKYEGYTIVYQISKIRRRNTRKSYLLKGSQYQAILYFIPNEIIKLFHLDITQYDKYFKMHNHKNNKLLTINRF